MDALILHNRRLWDPEKSSQQQATLMPASQATEGETKASDHTSCYTCPRCGHFTLRSARVSETTILVILKNMVFIALLVHQQVGFARRSHLGSSLWPVVGSWNGSLHKKSIPLTTTLAWCQCLIVKRLARHLSTDRPRCPSCKVRFCAQVLYPRRHTAIQLLHEGVRRAVAQMLRPATFRSRLRIR
jgi:hypothetical protein